MVGLIDRFEEVGRITSKSVPQERGNAASAMATWKKGGCGRAPLGLSFRSEKDSLGLVSECGFEWLLW